MMDNKDEQSEGSQADRPQEAARQPSADKPDTRSQADKFKDLAREVEADGDEAAFKDALRRMREDSTRRKAPKDEG